MLRYRVQVYLGVSAESEHNKRVLAGLKLFSESKVTASWDEWQAVKSSCVRSHVIDILSREGNF